MFGLIIFIVVLTFVGKLFSGLFFGYYRRPWIHPFGGFGGWGWGMGRGPMWHDCPHHHHHHHHRGMW